MVMNLPTTTYDRLVELAATQHGFVRTTDVDVMEISQGYLRKLVQAGRARHLFRGVYRLTAFPTTPLDEFQEAIFWAANDGAAIGGEAALLLLELADVNPRRIEVVVPPGHRIRRQENLRFKRLAGSLRERDIDFVGNIPVVAAPLAIAQAIKGGTQSSLVHQAITTARRRDLLDQLDEAKLRVALDERDDRATGIHGAMP